MVLPEDVKATMKTCIVIVICVSRGYKVNLACQRVARYALTREKHSIVFFCLLQGDYSMTSYPQRVDGWLGHMIKGACAASKCVPLCLVHPSNRIFAVYRFQTW